MMHRWRVQRIFRILIPVLLYVSLLCVVIVAQRSMVGDLVFASDEAYTHAAIARNLAETGEYGFAPEREIPITRDVLWRLLLWFTTWITRDAVSGSCLLGAVCSAITLLMLLRFGRLLFPFPPYVLYAATMVIVGPGFLLDVISGTSVSLATCLITAACLLHVEGMAGRRHVLPISSAFFIGMAAWIRMEFLIFWLVLSLHAWVLALLPGKKRGSSGVSYVVVRSIMGWLLIALCVLPLFAWNAVVIKVPWPRAVGAPLSLDAWAMEGSGTVLGKMTALSQGSLGSLYAAVYGSGFLQWGLGSFLFWLGVVVLIGLSIWRTEERAFTLVVFIPVFLPLFYSIIYPYVGSASVPIVFGTFAPMAALIAAYGFFRLPFLIEGLYRKWKQGIPPAVGFHAWWVGVGGIVLLICLFQSCSMVRKGGREMAERVRVRQEVSGAIAKDKLEKALFVTDRPGWLAYAHRAHMIDLTGESTAEVLMSLDSKGDLDPRRLKKYLREEKPSAMLIWDEGNLFMESLVETRRLYPPVGKEGPPELYSITWAFGF